MSSLLRDPWTQSKCHHLYGIVGLKINVITPTGLMVLSKCPHPYGLLDSILNVLILKGLLDMMGSI
jgi:hypothetical protein